MVPTRMKISIIMNILVLSFYGYIGDISMDILKKKIKIDQNLWKYKNNNSSNNNNNNNK